MKFFHNKLKRKHILWFLYRFWTIRKSKPQWSCQESSRVPRGQLCKIRSLQCIRACESIQNTHNPGNWSQLPNRRNSQPTILSWHELWCEPAEVAVFSTEQQKTQNYIYRWKYGAKSYRRLLPLSKFTSCWKSNMAWTRSRWVQRAFQVALESTALLIACCT